MIGPTNPPLGKPMETGEYLKNGMLQQRPYVRLVRGWMDAVVRSREKKNGSQPDPSGCTRNRFCFDILAWWKGKEAEFPVLSAMARDLLSSQAYTVVSESTFTTCGKVISLRRTRLSPKAVEMCICLKDPLDAVHRIQHLTNLEDGIEPESKIHDEEVLEGLSSEISDEELKEYAKRRGNK
ncbi:hypothetical protein QVD17_37943 [Tagetes erecta]|uniref:HAT C-terminal dimerisation domain-containing protein n=1 Tax=Tagetes erecta TaxID=13708 RepID=A0AAD8JUY1_TARER|nr:hypothetical protein QVD17_37943 [Tagetes erecta]